MAGDFKAAAEPGKQRLLQGNFAAERVDGGDAQLRGLIEQVPAELLERSKRAPSKNRSRERIVTAAVSGCAAAFSNSERMRVRISAAAARVKVMATIWLGSSTSPSNARKRWVSNDVLPEPAGACTSTERSVRSAASR